MNKITKDILKQIYLPRLRDSHKYDFGLLLVVGGGEFYTGSPALSAMAAFKAGVDMVQILAPKRAADVIATFSPNLAAFPLKGDWLDEEDVPTLISHIISAKTIFANSLNAREDALSAGANLYAKELWRDAEEQFREAAEQLEKGDRDDSYEESVKVVRLIPTTLGEDVVAVGAGALVIQKIFAKFG